MQMRGPCAAYAGETGNFLTQEIRRTPTTRRMGPAGSENWHAMLDATEATLQEEGYGALTSRRIAERVGVKQRLVYYYFQTMDELIVETFRRMSTRELERMRQTLDTDMPLRRLWDVSIHTTDARVVTEFMALAHRSEGLRKEVVHFIEESRRIQGEAVKRSLDRSDVRWDLDPEGVALFATGIALTMTREVAIGVTAGHSPVHDLVDRFLDRIEPVTDD